MKSLKSIRQKLCSPDEFIRRALQWREEGLRVVFTNGCFDLLHPGHADYLAKAASLGDRLLIGVNTDASVQKLKGPSRPIQSEEARMFLLASFGFTDCLTLFGEDTPMELIKACRPHVLVKGADYAVEGVAGGAEVMAGGGSVALLPYLPGYSTSAIEKKIRGNGF